MGMRKGPATLVIFRLCGSLRGGTSKLVSGALVGDVSEGGQAVARGSVGEVRSSQPPIRRKTGCCCSIPQVALRTRSLHHDNDVDGSMPNEFERKTDQKFRGESWAFGGADCSYDQADGTCREWY